jgi:hypothetical protein
MGRTDEEKQRLKAIACSIHNLWEERPNLTEEQKHHLDAHVKRLTEMIPEDLRDLLGDC